MAVRPSTNGLPLPEQFGPYRIVKRLGQGGMGTVFLAHDARLNRSVALNVCHIAADHPQELERFRRSRTATTFVILLSTVAVWCGLVQTQRAAARQPGADERPAAKRDQPDVLLPVEAKAAIVDAQLWVYVLRKNEKTGEVEIKVRLGPPTNETKFIPTTALEKASQATPLHTLRPQGMAIIAASFPYKAQVAEFRQKLRLRTEREVLEEKSEATGAAFRFLGVVVERRRVDATGKPLYREEGDNGYVPLDFGSDYEPFFVLSGQRTEDEDPELARLIMPGLVMPRLLSAHENQYPKIERALPTIKKSLAAFKARDALRLTDHCLIRVIDVTVRPGKSYEYRLRVNMANPNYKRTDVTDPRLAEGKELRATEWFEVPGVVTVPATMRCYAVDQIAIEGAAYRGINAHRFVGPDEIVLQLHQYVDYVDRGLVPVGDWVIAERVVVARGEAIDRRVRVEVPILVENLGRFGLAWSHGDQGKPEAGLDIPFEDVRGRPATLVDFDGPVYLHQRGRVMVRQLAPAEVVILSPEGTLLAHNSAIDARDPDRVARLQAWRTRIEALRKEENRAKRPLKPFGRP